MDEFLAGRNFNGNRRDRPATNVAIAAGQIVSGFWPMRSEVDVRPIDVCPARAWG
jgi:hypothetical protein